MHDVVAVALITAGGDVATHCIRQRETGVLYDDTIDPLPCGYTYDATDRPVLMELEAAP